MKLELPRILIKTYRKIVEFTALTGMVLALIGILLSFLTTDRGLVMTGVLGSSIFGGLFLMTYGLVSAQEMPQTLEGA